MPDSSLDRSWVTLSVDWPVHHLELAVEVVEPRMLTALEWVVLRVVEEFQPTPPPLVEVAEELGLDRPDFLHDTLREVVRLRALAPRDPEAPTCDLDGFAFTDSGHELYRRGQIEADPATHAIHVYIDALTDEDLPPLDVPTRRSGAPFHAGLAAPPTRASIGLDRVRSVMRRFHRDILGGDAVVRTAAVRRTEDTYRPVALAFRVEPDGVLTVDGARLSPSARELVRQSELSELGLIPRIAVTGAWDITGQTRSSAGHEHSEWRASTVRTVPVGAVAGEACATIGRARREVVLHPLWLAAAGVRAALDAARACGVHVVIAGGDVHLELSQDGAHLSVEVAATTGRALPGALIVDASEGLLIDDVSLRWRGAPIGCELAGVLTAAVAASHRRVLVDYVLDGLPDEVSVSPPPGGTRTESATVLALLCDRTVAPRVARLVLSPAEEFAAALQHALVARSDGLGRLEALRDASALVRALAPGVPSSAWEVGWRACWHETFATLRTHAPIPVADLERLLGAAPPAIAVEQFVDAATDAWAPASSPPGSVQRVALREIDALATRRWGRGAAARRTAWVNARDRNLVPVDVSEASLRSLAADAADLLGPRDAPAWALRVVANLPRPVRASEYAVWSASARALRPLAGAAWDGVALDVWRESAASAGDLAPALPGALELLGVEQLASALLAADAGPTRVLELRQQFAEARRDAGTSPFWATALRRALPPLAATYRAHEHGPLVRALAQGVAEWPAGQVALAEWGGRIADDMRHAADLPALVFWLAELAGLAPALARDVHGRAVRAVTEHQRSVRDACGKASPLWSRLCDAWRRLGLPREQLERLARPATARPTAAPPLAGKPTPKKGRRP